MKLKILARLSDVIFDADFENDSENFISVLSLAEKFEMCKISPNFSFEAA
jgi:hypothetical protein